ncbi:MAG: hypothetical protein IJC76_08790 [Lachnospiraceae bacterium]|nr:hypothetical protein [Lachnospiraceae bacterium]
MLKASSEFTNKLKNMAAVKKFSEKLHCRNNLLALLLVDTSLVPDSDIVRYQIYKDISKELTGKQDIHIYRLTDSSPRAQVGTLIRELSYRSQNQSEYTGIVVVEVPDDILNIEEYSLIFEFLEEQSWYTIISSSKDVEKIYKALAQSIFVDVYKLNFEDMERDALSEIFKEQYNICLSKDKEKKIYEYLSSLRTNDSDIKYEHIYIHQMAYNMVLNAIENENKSLKINDIAELMKGFRLDALNNDDKVKMGFSGCDISR